MTGSQDEKIQKAVQASLNWLSIVDEGKYRESWENASALLKKAVTADELSRSLEASRGVFGALESREPTSRSYETALPGAPDGEYVVIQCKSSFTHKKEAVETVTPMLEADDVWRVSGYYIK
jgi:hypothetical protein